MHAATDETTITPLILAGGSGTRLWPLSREQHPKQFLSLVGAHSMLQETLARLDGLPCRAPIIVCNEQHRFLAAEQLREAGIDQATLLLEPVARNTAPAIALAALRATAQGADPLLLVLAADHVIRDTAAFHRAVTQATELARRDRLVTFGIQPDRPETGYGYIKKGAPLGPGWQIAGFAEKPDRAQAQRYLDSGAYCWNSGMFLFKASGYLQALERHRPAMLAACRSALATAHHDLDFIRIDRETFARCPAESIDYAVMEQTQQGAMVALEAGWSDVGAWAALAAILPADAQGNCLRGDVLVEQTHDTLVHAGHRLVATLGVRDLVIVETKDAVLVAHKDQVQNVRQIVQRLQAAERPEYREHREVFRPWGVYDRVDQGERYQVKRITVHPGARLSVQMHHHRAEHWVVVRGTARVTRGEKTYLVTENQSTYIPIGTLHTLENPGVIPLELIEVQSGSYLGEDDIVRIEDRYGRT